MPGWKAINEMLSCPIVFSDTFIEYSYFTVSGADGMINT